MRKLLVSFVLCAAFASAQVTTASLDGTVTDPQGAVVAAAVVTVTNSETGQTLKETTDDRGRWALPSMPAGIYRITVAMKGFHTVVVDNVKLDAGVPATRDVQLELGATTETIEVSVGAEMVQTTNATVNSTMQGRQVFELPSPTRGGLDLLVSQVGVQTASVNRNSSINGLPNGALNVTLDGLNTQDQLLKSSNGFFTYIPMQLDAIEEVTLTTSAATVDSTGEGAAQIKFVTKGGTNEFRGGVFWQHRNTDLDANYYFNNINGVPRDRIILNQAGFHVGGPIMKNKLFFFENFEVRRIPNSASFQRTVLDPNSGAINGNYTYPDSKGVLHSVNVLTLAQQGGFPSTPDPIVKSTLSQINSLIPNGAYHNNVHPAPTTSAAIRPPVPIAATCLPAAWITTSRSITSSPSSTTTTCTSRRPTS
jgi:hypothetical protein